METRGFIQREAKQKWYEAKCKGTLAMATGSGKTVVAIDILKGEFDKNENLKVLLVTPTIILHEVNWRAEFEKFGVSRYYDKLERACYVSLPKHTPNDYDLIIFDEYHHISERGFEEFSSLINTDKVKVLGLTATPPKQGDRKTRFDEVCPVIFSYSITDAAGSTINDFHINVIKIPLDSVTKNVKAGTVKKSFFTTEKASYDYWSAEVERAGHSGSEQELMWKSLGRKRALDTFPSRIHYAETILEKKLDGQCKHIVFAPSIQQAEALGLPTFHSKGDDTAMKEFIAGTIEGIATVTMADEGLTMGKVEAALIMKLNATDKTFVQRIGRVCRNDLDKVSQIYVLVYTNTVEEKYLKNALSSIDDSKVTYKTIQDYE